MSADASCREPRVHGRPARADVRPAVGFDLVTRFLAATALAFDNEYDIAIILTKPTTALAKQTCKRVAKEFAEFVEGGLREAGFAVERATDGLSGFEQAVSHPYDAAIVDVMLPRMDGLALIDSLRARGVRTPVLILSAKRTVDDRVRGLQAGVTVANTDGQSGTLAAGFTFLGPQPTVTGIAPSSGATAGGTAVTISGTNFVSGATVTIWDVDSDRELCAIPVIVTSSLTVDSPGAWGADAQLEKPLDAEQLARKIRHFVPDRSAPGPSRPPRDAPCS